MKVALIVAMSQNRAIGKENQLPWRLSADLKRFKKITWGHTLIMGRRTFESIGKPLPGRRFVVLTRQADYRSEGITTAPGLEAAFRICRGEEEVFIAGGALVYAQAMSRVQQIYLTLLHHHFEGDAFFPEVDWSKWRLTCRQEYFPDPVNRYHYSFLNYRRVFKS